MPGQVTVATKLPHGLILRVFDMEPFTEHVMGGGTRESKVAVERPMRVEVAGVAHPQNHGPKAPIVAGYALTHNVDKDFWDLWLLQNKDSDMVKNHLIFAHEKSGNTEAVSREHKDQRSGLERLDPTKMGRKLEVAKAPV